MANELLTNYERKILERDNRLISQYLSLRSQYPEAKDNRIFGLIASKEKLTVVNVRTRLLKRGVIQKRTNPAAV